MFDAIFFSLAHINARLAIWAYMKLYVALELWKKNGPGYLTKFYGSVVDAYARMDRKRPCTFMTVGDSVKFAGRLHWTSFPNTIDKSIPGDTVSNFTKRIVPNIAAFSPKVVYVHIGGNDVNEQIMTGKFSLSSAADVAREIVDALKKIKDIPSVQKVVWEEILPLGKNQSAAHAATRVVNTIMKAKARAMPHVFEVLSISEALAGPDGFIRDRFAGEDGIHVNQLAYDEAWGPYWKDHASKTAAKLI